MAAEPNQPGWLEEALKTVVSALECIMDVSSTNEDRMNSYKVCEDFRENCPTCIECGFQLAQKNNSDVVRHFGLQSVEHWIKYRWHEVDDDKKVALKKISLDYIFQGTRDILEECRHTKDAVTRILVELMKRLWPQLWEDLFIDFTRLSEHGETQTELVLMVLLRLCEDVVLFQTVPSPRRNDLRQSLNRAMPSIITFYLHILSKNLDNYRVKENKEKQKALTVCYAVMETLNGFVEWIPVTHITDTALLPQICSLLLDEDQGLCLRATECLLLIVGRRGVLTDRKPLMILFSKEGMTLLLRAATNATEHISSPDKTGFCLIFLKRLCEILLEMGKQLCTLWGSDVDQGQPENFDMYLKAVLAFTQHPCLSLRDMTIVIWQMILRHSMASKDKYFIEILPALVQSATVCLLKLGFPSQNNSIICDYSRKEFDSDEEFNEVLCHLRMQVLEMTRSIATQHPLLAFEAGCAWLKELLSKPVDTGNNTGLCTPASPSHLAWDGCCVFLEAVIGKVVLTDAQLDTKEGVALLQGVLGYDGNTDIVTQLFKVETPKDKHEDPLILSSVLSCLSALFPFLTYTPETLSQVLAKIKAAVVFNLPGQTRSNRSPSVKNVRVHACSVFVKLCKNYPSLIVPDFKSLYDGIKALDQDPECPSQMERIILTEALIIVCNEFHNYELQSAFIEEVMQPVKDLWSSQDFVTAFSQPEHFMKYVGLDQAAVEPSSADTCGINRSHIHYCISMILAVIKRTKWPEDYAKACEGGFMVPCSSGTKALRNPAFPHVICTFNNLILLLRTICNLFKPEYLQLRHPDFQKAYELTENEKLIVIGFKYQNCQHSSNEESERSLTKKRPLDRMQVFLINLCETSFHILGSSAVCLGNEFYSPRWAKVLIDNVTSHIPLLPDNRLRMMIHNFMKSFFLNCPRERFDDVAIPLLQSACPFYYEKLVARWQMLNQKVEERSQNDDDEPTDTNEILEETLIRNLTKEYLDFINQILFGKNTANTEAKEENAMEECNISMAEGSIHTLRELNELGTKILGMQELYPSFMMCIITGLSWADSICCQKCVLMLWPLCKRLWEQKELNAEAAQFTFMAVLSGVSLHGQHENLNAQITALALTLYEALRHEFPTLTSVLEQIPNIDTGLLKELHEKYLDVDENNKDDIKQERNRNRRKKDLFKKILANIAGKNIGQKFTRQAQYSSMPRLFLQTWRQRHHPRLDEGEEKDLGLAELFTPEGVN